MTDGMSKKISIGVQILAHGEGLPLPAYATPEAAGLDLVAAIAADAPLMLTAGQTAMVPTGLAIALPQGYEAQVRPRSGLAAKHAITVLNSPGTIDSDYRGEVKVILINHGNQDFLIERGERIAQMVIAPVVQGHWEAMQVLPETERGAGGFGSTGTATAASKGQA